MTHQKNGALIQCSECEAGNCANCTGINGTSRCHHGCQPMCPRPECVAQAHTKVVVTEVCLVCFILPSVTGVCGCP
jgi:hypothetical protein